MEDGNPFGGLKMVATKKGDGERDELGRLKGTTEMAISSNSMSWRWRSGLVRWTRGRCASSM
ncbi:unnamed protein product [Prunus armeniaca]|uniref:Uncharacterized protein n=1 Tax=Prunus armeniaca TaxID=36596 RepID=A0A6J5X9F7_PRUAR|nr:unnamed protein product [Prunus armeniaca]